MLHFSIHTGPRTHSRPATVDSQRFSHRLERLARGVRENSPSHASSSERNANCLSTAEVGRVTKQAETLIDRAGLLESAATVARSASPRPWEVTLESRQFGADADVLCRRDGAGGSVYVAINFVTGAADPDETRARHDALEASGVRTAWFMADHPAGIFMDVRTVVFRAVESWRTEAGDLPEWSFAGVRLATEAAVAALLAGHFRLRQYLLLSGPYYIRLDPEWRSCSTCETRFIGVAPTVLRADDHGELVNPACSSDPAEAMREQSVIGQLVARTIACDPWKAGPVSAWRPVRDVSSGRVTWKGYCPSCDAVASGRDDMRPPEAPRTGAKLPSLTYTIKAPPIVVEHSHWCYGPGTSRGSHCPNPPAAAADVLTTHEAPVLAATSLWSIRKRPGLERDLTELIAPMRSGPSTQPGGREVDATASTASTTSGCHPEVDVETGLQL